jgi:GT2 family glycosyltransferase
LVYAGILNWNGAAHTIRCVDHVLGQSYPRKKVAVVDNGSRPDDLDALRRDLPPACERVELPANLGFAAGMNVVLRRAVSAGAAYAWLLNNDAFAEPDCLARLAAALRHNPAVAVVSPLLYGSDGVEQHAGGRIRWDTLEHDQLRSEHMAEPVSFGHWLTGTALLVRLSALQGVGEFDERFFAYWEEVDLLCRLARRGHVFHTVLAARCLHLGSASTGGPESPFAEYMNARNTWLFARKHVSPRHSLETLLRLAARQLDLVGVHRLRGREPKAEAVFAGALDGALGRYGRPRSLRTTGPARLPLLRPWVARRLVLSAMPLLGLPTPPARSPHPRLARRFS